MNTVVDQLKDLKAFHSELQLLKETENRQQQHYFSGAQKVLRVIQE